MGGQVVREAVAEGHVMAAETHPAFALIGAYRTQTGPRGKPLFDSDILHRNTVVLRIERAERTRDLHQDWIHGRATLIEVEMSEAQWASFVSSMNTSGVPCTLRRLGTERVEDVEYAPRLEESMDETRRAADEAFAAIIDALREFEATPATPKRAKDEALAKLRAVVSNAAPNVAYAGKTLGEHAENVVQKARADVEAMVTQHAARIGLDAAPSPLALPVGEEDD